MLCKRFKKNRRKERTRFKLKSVNKGGDAINRVRLCFYTSNKYIYGQIIDDNKKVTITSLSTHNEDFKDLKSKNNIKAALMLGKKVAKVLIKKEIRDVYFDRGNLIYHGKAKAFAESARKNGLNF